jgi:hypothetical protein
LERRRLRRRAARLAAERERHVERFGNDPIALPVYDRELGKLDIAIALTFARKK